MKSIVPGFLHSGIGTTPKGGLNWGRSWTPSNKSDIIAGGDGTIVTIAGNKYLRCIRGRHFLITGYDFPDGWSKGIPYKSAATVSAPANDAILIAADVNNFLYANDVTHTPNQIPVVSLYQNVDYAHKIYFKHVAQSVDSNGVETIEPKVSEWAVYGTARAGAAIATTNTYFGVPVEATTNMRWVDGVNGDDAKTGTRAEPVKTIKRAVALASAGHTIYVRTGICTETNGAYNLLLQKALTIIGTGFTQVRGGGDTSNPIIRVDVVGVATLKNLIVDGTTGYDTGIQLDSADKVVERCLVRNTDVEGIYVKAAGTVKHCVVLSKRIYCSGTGAALIDTCYIKSSTTAPLTLNNAALAATVLNCKMRSSAGITYFTYMVALTSLVFKGCKFYLDHDCTPTYIDPGINAAIEYAYNQFYVTATLTHEVIYYSGTTSLSTFNVHDNTFVVTNAVMTNSILCLKNTPAAKVKNNIFTSSAPHVGAIVIQSAGHNCDLPEIENNVMYLRAVTSYGICIGSEGTGAGDNHIDGAIIKNNLVRCAGYFNASLLDTVTTHGIFVGYNINATIKHNRVEGAGYGIILKASGMVDVSGVVMYNLVHNCKQGIRIKGMKAVKIYNNTVSNSSAIEMTNLYITNNAGTNECEDFIVKNNIFQSSTGRLCINIADKDGGVIDYNDYNALTYLFTIVSTTYATVALYKAGETMDANSVDTDPVLSDMYPTVKIVGVALAAAYDDGLDASTVWGNETTLSAIVTKQQGAAWEVGTYVNQQTA